MNKEELLKSIDNLLKSFDDVSDEKAKGTDIALPANGGSDVIKNKDEKDKELEKTKKAKAEKKDDDGDADDDEKKDKKEMKKSIEISEQDFEILQKAKKEIEDKAKEESVKNDPMFKAVSGLTDLVKSQSDLITRLSGEIETLKKSPAREPKSLTGLEPVKKGEGDSEKKTNLKKSQVLTVLEDLCEKGKISANSVCEYEATNNIQDNLVKSLVRTELNQKYGASI